MADFDLVCIGSGPAGQRAAVQAAKLRCRVAVIEKRHYLGGACVETGTIPSKTFREAVLWFAALKRRGRPERPRVTDLLARVSQVTRREQEVIDDQLRRNDVTVIHGEASFTGPHTLAVTTPAGARSISADRFVIAVGTTPAPPPDVAADPPRRAVLTLESGKRIVADAALFSAGRVAATAALGLAAAGLAGDERGRLAVDETFRTAVPHVYAAGDVIGYPSLAATSSEQGRLAACHALGVKAGPMARHFPVGIYSVPELSMVGAPEHELTGARVPYEVGLARYREIARGQIMEDESGLLKLLFDREDGRLLGVHAIGVGATELIHVGQAVLGLGGGLDYFLETVFNYPTLAECYKVAALDAYNKLQR